MPVEACLIPPEILSISSAVGAGAVVEVVGTVVVVAVVVCGVVVTVAEVVTACAGSGVLVSTALFFLLTMANTDDAAMIATATQTIGMVLLRDVFTFISISLRSLTMDIQAKQKVESS